MLRHATAGCIESYDVRLKMVVKTYVGNNVNDGPSFSPAGIASKDANTITNFEFHHLTTSP